MPTTTKRNLVLLPGLLNDARLYQQQIADLSDITQTSVADLTGAETISALAENVLAHAPARFVLAGLSMGGYVALEIMRQAPTRVQALALLDTSARPDTPEATENRKRLMKLAETDFQTVIDTLIPKLVHPSHLKYTTIVDVINLMAHKIGKEVFMRQQRAIIGRLDSRPFLQQIDCPALILCGREDVITPVEIHEEMAAGIPGSQLAVIAECGHLSTLGQPKVVAAALRTWLSATK